MKQFSFRLEKLIHLDLCITAFQEQCPKEFSAILALVFTSNNDPDTIQNLLDILAEKIPQAQVAGSTTFGEIAAGRPVLQTTIITFMVFTHTQIELKSYDILSLHTEDAGKNLFDACEAKKDLAGIGLLATLKTLNIKPMLECLSKLPSSIPVFGCSANAYEMNAPTYVFSNDGILQKGIIAICFLGKSLHIHITKNIGWKPLGRSMIITSTYGNNIVCELDNKPAISVYEKYLNISKNKRFYTETVEFPIFIERNGRNMARLPFAYTDDGALIFTADCQKGERVRLAYGDPNEILRNSKANQRETLDFVPEGILLLSCASRRIFLQDNIKVELEPYRDIAPVAGFFTCGEITRVQDDIEVLNITMLAVSFREGKRPQSTAASYLKRSAPTSLNDSISLVQRMAKFIAATTTELEEANLQLEKLARQDRLTELYNRGEIEHILQTEIDCLAENQLPLSVIMLDVDNFKRVNDTYGHDIGDKVLKTTAQVLMANIRYSDYAGRWGGEEFLVILPRAPLDAAISIAERIRIKLAELYALPDGKNVTASFGVAEIQPDEPYLDFYRRLDSLLYTAKQTGKNKVVGKTPETT